MNIEKFIEQCREHDFEYHTIADVYLYKLEKLKEYQLRIEVQRQPEFGELYLAFKNGAFDT